MYPSSLRPVLCAAVLWVATFLAVFSLRANDDTIATPPEGLSGTEWSSIRAAHETWLHRFEPGNDGSFTAQQPGQGWRLHFDRRGFTARPQGGTGEEDGWAWGLELAVNSPPEGEGVVEGNRLSYDRGDGITEWFINDGRGLEQGWTLTKPVGPLRLKVRGTLEAEIAPQSVRFGGRITYSGLKAWDATGATVPVWFEAATDSDAFALHYDDTGATYPLTIDPLAQSAYLKASNTNLYSKFGWSVSVSGDTVVVGAPDESSNSTGVNSVPNFDNNANGSGAAYVFVRRGSTWSQQAYLKASKIRAEDGLGYSVAVSGDTLVVGAATEDSNSTGVNGNGGGFTENSGAAYVFVRQGTTWTQQAFLKASNPGEADVFGVSVAVSGDTVVVGAQGENSNTIGINSTPDDDGTANSSGAAYVFVRRGTSWSQQAYLKASNTGASDGFGTSVAISDNTVVVGADWEDSNTTGINSTPDDDGTANNSGAAYVFVRRGPTWSQQAYLKASNTGAGDVFGNSVAISGDTVVVGAYLEDSNTIGINSTPDDDGTANGSGAAYVFSREGTTWTQQAYLKASNTGADDNFGFSVSVSGDTVVVGAGKEDSNTTGINTISSDPSPNFDSGAAYVFMRQGVSWSEQAYLKASNTGQEDYFGSAIAVSGDTVVVGAYQEDSNTTGIDSTPNDPSIFDDTGAAYLFQVGPNFRSLSRTGNDVLGTSPDLAFAFPGNQAVRGDGDALFESRLFGSGARGGRNRAMFGTFGPMGTTDLLLQRRDDISGFGDGLPYGASVNQLLSPSANNGTFGGLFQATLFGRGINATNNRALILDKGDYLRLVRRTGTPLNNPVGGVTPRLFKEVLQSPNADFLAACVALQPGVGGVTRNNDSGILLMNHSGNETATTNLPFEGQPAYVLPDVDFGQVTGPMGISLSGDLLSFGAMTRPTGGGQAGQGVFYVSSGAGNTGLVQQQGDAAPQLSGGETFRSFPAITDTGVSTLVRATLSRSPAGTNEGVWDLGFSNTLLLRKGTTFDAKDGAGNLSEDLVVARLLRFWPVNIGISVQHVFQVVLRGPGVNGANNQALLMRQADGTYRFLLRSGDPAPGISLDRVKIARIVAVDINPVSGHYAVLAILRGAPANANLALFGGKLTLGNDTDQAFRRLPSLVLSKGEVLDTGTSRGIIRSLFLRPAPDRTGAGGRGLGQVVGSGGHMIFTATVDRRVQEVIVAEP